MTVSKVSSGVIILTVSPVLLPVLERDTGGGGPGGGAGGRPGVGGGGASSARRGRALRPHDAAPAVHPPARGVSYHQRH